MFDGITDRLIPLFAIGAFLAFTLSQTGMVMHWWKQRVGGAQSTGVGSSRIHGKLAINLIGAVATAVAVTIIVATKFREGAWITIVAIPLLIAMFKAVKRYYDHVETEIRSFRPLDLGNHQPPVVIITAERWNRLVAKALHFGMRISGDVIVIHLGEVAEPHDEGKEERFRQDWHRYVEMPAEQSRFRCPRLIRIHSRFRKFVAPLLECISKLQEDFPNREVAIIVPELVKSHFWEYLLHNHRARRLRAALLRHGRRLTLITVPWHLEEAAASSNGDAVHSAGQA